MITVCFLTANASGQDNAEIKNKFEPGLGLPVGEIELVQGMNLIFHENENFAYKAEKSLPVFKGDTIVTKEKSLVRIKLNDGSITTLASSTSLTLSRSDYEPEKETRSTFINMGIGKARFVVSKMTNFINSKFNVKTKTAVVGVRGSDFIVISNPESTEIAALNNTELNVLSMDAPGSQTMLNEFENTIVNQGEMPSSPEPLLPERVEILKELFNLTPDFEEKKEMPENPLIEKQGVLVSKDLLVMPENIKISTTGHTLELFDIKKESSTEEKTEEIIKEQQERLVEQQQEELRRFEFPVTPE